MDTAGYKVGGFMNKQLDGFNKFYKDSKMEYPIDMVINFLEKRYSMLDYDTRKNIKALDVGFGPGNNLKGLLDYGFLTYGIDYSEVCVNQVKEKYGHYENIREVWGGDVLSCKIKETFDVILCTGTIFLNPLDEIEKILDILYNLLNSSNGYGNMLINFYLGDADEFTYYPMFKNKIKVQLLTFPTMKKLLENANFVIENIEYTYYEKIIENRAYKRYWFEVKKNN